MDLEDSVQILKNILVSEKDQASKRNRFWARKLTLATARDSAVSSKIAATLGSAFASNPTVLLVPRSAIALYNSACLHKLGVERLEVPGIFKVYTAKEVPERLLFRKPMRLARQTPENAALVVDLKTQWLEVLPYECRIINNKLVIRAASYLEKLREAAEHDILRVINLDEWKKASKKERAKLEYCSIAAFDRVLLVNLLRKNFLQITPKAAYWFHSHDGEILESTPHSLHHLIFAVNKRNRYRFFSPKAKAIVLRRRKKALLEKEAEIASRN